MFQQIDKYWNEYNKIENREIIKVENIKGNEINFESANTMYENAISFINDITQGFYFN